MAAVAPTIASWHYNITCQAKGALGLSSRPLRILSEFPHNNSLTGYRQSCDFTIYHLMFNGVVISEERRRMNSKRQLASPVLGTLCTVFSVSLKRSFVLSIASFQTSSSSRHLLRGMLRCLRWFAPCFCPVLHTYLPFLPCLPVSSCCHSIDCSFYWEVLSHSSSLNSLLGHLLPDWSWSCIQFWAHQAALGFDHELLRHRLCFIHF